MKSITRLERWMKMGHMVSYFQNEHGEPYIFHGDAEKERAWVAGSETDWEEFLLTDKHMKDSCGKAIDFMFIYYRSQVGFVNHINGNIPDGKILDGLFFGYFHRVDERFLYNFR